MRISEVRALATPKSGRKVDDAREELFRCVSNSRPAN